MKFLDTITMEEDPYLDEKPEEIQAFHLDGTPDEALTAELNK